MKNRKEYIVAIVAVILMGSIALSSCKSCNKKDATVGHADSTATPVGPPSALAGANLPHADTSVAPILARIMDEVFDASKKKDYAKLASYLVYRGPDMKRFGYATFTTKSADERAIVRITGEVFNKWASTCETKDYARVFALAQPDGREMTVLEVIFASPKAVNRKFFGFLALGPGDYKIVDVTSNLDLPQ